MTSRRDPIATYRLQLTPDFGFEGAIGLLDHFAALGVSHLYLSPIAEAVPGSTHGYDVVDHRQVRAEFGGMAGLVDLLEAADRHGLGVVIDHVPNHASVERPALNPRWWAMLRDGPGSDAARWFDIDWEAGDGRVIIPRLGKRLTDVLADGGIELGTGDLGPELRYGALRFPLAPGTERLDLAEALSRQHYHLQWWRDPARNVRRFFTIDDLVALRVEHADVAAAVDTIPIAISDHPGFAGVRIDHVDGLVDPGAYLARLRQRLGDDAWILVEKILADGEWLPPTWPVAGTTGYEHIRTTEHALLEPDAGRLLLRQWETITDDRRQYEVYEDSARREVLDAGLRPDLERLERVVAQAAGETGSDGGLIEPIMALTLALDRYRTYLPGDGSSDEVLATAERSARHADPGLADQISRVANLVRTDDAVCSRWQQLTGPVMAKGAEDRAFYRYFPLAALCEVGGNPGRFSVTPGEFHSHARSAQLHAPGGLLAGSTHDTKRAEHVRARALALAERADEWLVLVDECFHRVAPVGRGLDARAALLALETTVTATPLSAERLGDYLVKAMREAELHTDWSEPDAAYEHALRELAADLVADVELAGSDLCRFAARTEQDGWRYAMAERAIRLTAPGVPDLYQGSLSPMMSLVDPDNRRPPDWDEQRGRLALASEADTATVWRSDRALALVSLTADLLALRRRRPTAFARNAGYEPLAVEGPLADRVLAFARTAGDEPVAVVAACPVDPERTGVETTMDATVIGLPAGDWGSVLAPHAEPRAESAALASWLPQLPVLVLERSTPRRRS